MSTEVTVDSIRNCLEGAVPAAIATCAADGTPNVSFLSQVHYLDSDHVALSYQFFNKTRQNILANPHATLQIIDPDTVAQYRLSLRYLRTETSGGLFETMKAKLAGIASHVGMQDVFRLLGADVYRVCAIEHVPTTTLSAAKRNRSLLSATRQMCERLVTCKDMAGLLDHALANLNSLFGIEHAMVMMLDEEGRRLYTVASLGYSESGVGSEVALGEGVIGVAARERIPIRITHMTSEYSYSRAARESVRQSGLTWDNATEIPFPGLAPPHSQIALPITISSRVIGVLFAESSQDMRFCYDEEDALATIAVQLGAMLQSLQPAAADEGPSSVVMTPAQVGPPATIRFYATDSSVFIDNDYLIKGVAGAIFWKLARDFLQNGRTEFTNRELRLAADISLPEITENLEARLILLQRRLAERCAFIRIEKTGRGRFHFGVSRPLILEDVPRSGPR